jgi:DNA repair exonuclease SbcCD ATPase subunit
MFDALKKRSQGGKSMEEQVAELKALIDTAREERGALSTMLTQIEVRAGKVSLPQVSKAVQKASDKADGASKQIEALEVRLTHFEGQTKVVAEFEGRLGTLNDSVSEAQASAEKLLAPGWGTAEAPLGGPAALVAGAADEREPGIAEGRAGRAGGAAEEPPRVPERSEGGHPADGGAQG